MKTIRTILATFGMTTLLYGAFALFCVSIDPAFTARSIYQLFRDTGFPFLVVGIACLLSVLIISFAVAAFRDEPKNRRAAAVDEEQFLEEETVPVEEYERQWTPELKKKSRDALSYEQSDDAPDLFAEDDAADEASDDDAPALDETLFRQPQQQMRRCVFCGTAYPETDAVCPKCGRRA